MGFGGSAYRYMYVCMHVCIYNTQLFDIFCFVCRCIRICINIYIYICLSVCLSVCMYVCTVLLLLFVGLLACAMY